MDGYYKRGVNCIICVILNFMRVFQIFCGIKDLDIKGTKKDNKGT